jgi:tetratricopeptide (TPR) repeat protein
LPEVAGYEILGEIGRGATSVVYKVRQHGLHRLVALKMLLDGPHAAHGQLARFHFDAKAIARLHHPNIVQIHDIGIQDGRPFFTMEFVAAGNLAQHLAGTPQDPRSAAQLVQTLAQAIHAAHREGIVHRDLKPANILLATRDQPAALRGAQESGTSTQTLRADSYLLKAVPKITDFGLAKQVALPPDKAPSVLPTGVAGVGNQLTGSGAILGTPSYMAPEQAQVLETVTRDKSQDPYYADRLGSAYINRGFVAITAGRLEQALESCTRAAEILEAAYRKAPHWIDVRSHLASAHVGQAEALMHLNRPAESLPHWKRALELYEGPEGNAYRLQYGLALIKAGDHAAAAAQAQALVAAANTSGEMLYNAGCVYSLCSRAVRSDEKASADYREMLAENYAVRAVEALHKADAAGMFESPANREHLKNDADLASLLPRKDFQALLRGLEQRTSSTSGVPLGFIPRR